MKNWQEQLCTSILSVMRYVFKDADGNFPKEIDEDEWLGTPTSEKQRDSGVKDYLIDLITSEKQKAYFSGFKDGAKATFDDLLTLAPKEVYTGIVFNETENMNGAWKHWDAFYKNDS